MATLLTSAFPPLLSVDSPKANSCDRSENFFRRQNKYQNEYVIKSCCEFWKWLHLFSLFVISGLFNWSYRNVWLPPSAVLVTQRYTWKTHVNFAVAEAKCACGKTLCLFVLYLGLFILGKSTTSTKHWRELRAHSTGTRNPLCCKDVTKGQITSWSCKIGFNTHRSLLTWLMVFQLLVRPHVFPL